eukprot:TRINITY_DN2155_c0_g1_i2.p1 TRINITY_DN2155_c0_g1~~TRINITY_DN2155_c0_g1_i2.p1  ORF type:complete len:281 (+),score=38.67 TRINITY_DN2155_c0_g1_i2:46-843(+)
MCDQVPKVWPIPHGQCRVADPLPECCEGEHCGILRTDANSSSYIGQDSITVYTSHHLSAVSGSIETPEVTYSCLSQDCDEFCIPSISVQAEGKSKLVHGAKLDCICCGCENESADEGGDCCEEGKGDFKENDICPVTVPKACEGDGANEYTDCYCCELAKRDAAAGACACHDCICGGSEFEGGCHPKYLECCRCSYVVDMKYEDTAVRVDGQVGSALECCATCEEPDCKAWMWNGRSACYQLPETPIKGITSKGRMVREHFFNNQ